MFYKHKHGANVIYAQRLPCLRKDNRLTEQLSPMQGNLRSGWLSVRLPQSWWRLAGCWKDFDDDLFFSPQCPSLKVPPTGNHT